MKHETSRDREAIYCRTYLSKSSDDNLRTQNWDKSIITSPKAIEPVATDTSRTQHPPERNNSMSNNNMDNRKKAFGRSQESTNYNNLRVESDTGGDANGLTSKVAKSFKSESEDSCDSSNFDQQEENINRRAGSSSKRKAASRKQNASKRFKTDPNDRATGLMMAGTLFGCTDVVSVIFSFLDIKQLLRFACVSKEFQGLLTYEHVIRSAMLAGGFPLTSLERVIGPIRFRKIWIPSPLRLLRLACGKRCERCLEKNRFANEGFGVFWCKKCTNSSTRLFRKSKQWKGYIDAPRVSWGPQKGSTKTSQSYLMLEPIQDIAGHPIGPLVTVQDLERMANDGDRSKTPAQKVAAWTKQCDAYQPMADAAVRAILKAVEDNRQDAVKRRVTVKEEKVEARDKLGEARRKKSDELKANFMDLFKDDPDIVAQLNAIQWSPRQNQYVFNDGYGQRSIASKLLTPVFKAPSKYAAKKKLQQVADQVRLKLEEKQLMERYIHRIAEHCGGAEVDVTVLKRFYRTFSFSYSFSNPAIRDILKEPLSKPLDLSDEDVMRLADQVKRIADRKEPGEEILQKLEQRLEGVPNVEDLNNRNWNSWNWSWMFKVSYVQDILYETISQPEEVTEERLDELEQRLRTTMEKKKLVKDRMQVLLAPIAKSWPQWYNILEQWQWDAKNNVCSFWDLRARQFFGGEKLANVEQLDDTEIEELSNHAMEEIAKRHIGSGMQ